MTNNSRISHVVVTIAAMWLLALAPAPVVAQGRGNAIGKGRQKAPSTVVTASAGESPAALAAGGREFGTWLDDATVADPGSGWISLALGHSVSPAGQQTDFPSLDAAVGWTKRVQIGMTVPHSSFQTIDGATSSGRGDMYISAKIALGDSSALRGPRAFAISPLIEVLSQPDPVNGHRTFFALPINAETRAGPVRLYGSSGYFSRGVLFAGGAVEVPAAEHLIVTTAFTLAHSLHADPAADAAGLSSTRRDISGGAAYALSRSFTIFGSIGRTISAIDANGASLTLATGVAFTFAPKTAKRIPRKHP